MLVTKPLQVYFKTEWMHEYKAKNVYRVEIDNNNEMINKYIQFSIQILISFTK